MDNDYGDLYVDCRCGLSFPLWSIKEHAGTRYSECGDDLKALKEAVVARIRAKEKTDGQ